MSSLQRTHELLATGFLSGWGGAGLLMIAAGWVCFHLSRELVRRSKEPTTVRILFGLRVAIVLVVIWLLCQPMLITRTVWREKPRVLVLESQRGTMNTREEFGALHRKMDALVSLRLIELKERNPAASKIRRRIELQRKVLVDAQKRFSNDLSNLTSGLPPSPGFEAAVESFVQRLKEAGGRVSAARNLLPEGSTDQAFQTELSEFTKRLSLNRAAIEKLAAEIGVAVNEASQHPDLLEKFVESLQETLTDSESLIALAGGIQAGLDKQLLEASALSKIEKSAKRRKELAQQTAQLITDRIGNRAEVIRLPNEDLTEGLQLAASEQLKGQLSSIFILDDGTRETAESASEILTTLSEGQVSIHTVLIGEDGAEPIDVGLMAVELPLNAESGVRFKGRALVKVKTPEEVKTRLIIKSGEELLGEVEVPKADAGVVEFEVATNKAGRHKVAVELVSDASDSFAGNEVIERVVHVHEAMPVVMIISDGLSREFVMMRQIAQAIPHLEIESVAAVPKIGELVFGEKKGQFPKTPKQWERIKLLVLLGGVPDGLDEGAVEALRSAISNGLQVLLVGSDEEMVKLSGADEEKKKQFGKWSELFELKTRSAARRLATLEGAWLSFYSLGTDLQASMNAWGSLPEVAAGTSSVEGGISMLQGDPEADSSLKLLPMGKGGIMYCGVSALTELRQGGSEKVVNRLVRGVIEFAVMPWNLQASGATLPKGLDKLRGLVIDGLRNVSDFKLAARAAPLQEMAEQGNGAFTDLVGLPELLERMELDSVQKSKVETWALWEGWWPLGLILLFASAEYLLRRKAGRVM